MMRKIKSNDELGAVMAEFALMAALMIPLLFGAILLLVLGVKIMLFNGSFTEIDKNMGCWETGRSMEEQVKQKILKSGLGKVYGKDDELTVEIDVYDDGRNNSSSKITDIPYTEENADTGEMESWIFEIEEVKKKEVLRGNVQYNIDVNFILGRKKICLTRKLDIEDLREVKVRESRKKDEGEV